MKTWSAIPRSRPQGLQIYPGKRRQSCPDRRIILVGGRKGTACRWLSSSVLPGTGVHPAPTQILVSQPTHPICSSMTQQPSWGLLWSKFGFESIGLANKTVSHSQSANHNCKCLKLVKPNEGKVFAIGPLWKQLLVGTAYVILFKLQDLYQELPQLRSTCWWMWTFGKSNVSVSAV